MYSFIYVFIVSIQCLDCKSVYSTRGNLDRHEPGCQQKEAKKQLKLKCAFCGAPDGDGNFFRDVYKTADHIFTTECWDRIEEIPEKQKAKFFEPTLDNFELVKNSETMKRAFARVSRVTRLPPAIGENTYTRPRKSPSMSTFNIFKSNVQKTDPDDRNLPGTSSSTGITQKIKDKLTNLGRKKVKREVATSSSEEQIEQPLRAKYVEQYEETGSETSSNLGGRGKKIKRDESEEQYIEQYEETETSVDETETTKPVDETETPLIPLVKMDETFEFESDAFDLESETFECEKFEIESIIEMLDNHTTTSPPATAPTPVSVFHLFMYSFIANSYSKLDNKHWNSESQQIG